MVDEEKAGALEEAVESLDEAEEAIEEAMAEVEKAAEELLDEAGVPEEAEAEADAPPNEPDEPAEAEPTEEEEKIMESDPPGTVTQRSPEMFLKLRKAWLSAGKPRRLTAYGSLWNCYDQGKIFSAIGTPGGMGDYGSLSTSRIR